MVLMAMARRQNNQILRNPCGKWQQFKTKRKRAGPDPYNCLDLLISWTQTIHFCSSYSVWFFLESWFWNYFEESKREQKENITCFHFKGSLIITKADWLGCLEVLLCCFKKKANCNFLMAQAFFILHVIIKGGFVSRSKIALLCFQLAPYRASTQEKSSILSRNQKTKTMQEDLFIAHTVSNELVLGWKGLWNYLVVEQTNNRYQIINWQNMTIKFVIGASY